MINWIMSISILASVFYLSTGLQAATFNVATPTEFQAALTAAQANGQDDTITVAAGTYAVGTTLTYATAENYGLDVVGAGATTTILDGGGDRQCLTLTNAGNGSVSVSGLTCQNGRAANLGGGLAIDCVNGAITLRNCRLVDNLSDRSAGGVYIGGLNGAVTVDSCVIDGNLLDPVTGDDGAGVDIYIDTGGTADITLQNCTITNNTIGECPSAVGSPDGAGVFMYHLGSGGTVTVRNNVISNNTALGGPAGFYFRAPVDCTLVFEGNTLSGNSSGRSAVGATGGGVHLQFDVAAVTFSNNKVLNNRAIGPYANGGGMDLEMEGGSCEIINNAFAGNTAQQHGGGISLFVGSGVTRTVIAGNLFVNNQAGGEDGSGGGLMLNTDCNVTMANNSFYGNSAANAGGLGYYAEGAGRSLTIANDIYRSNAPGSVSNMGTGSMTATYSNIQGGTGESWFGTGCIDADPLFYNASNPPGADGIYATVDDGLHLTAGSPSMNKGSNAAVPATLTTDLAGQTRIQEGTVDMGAYEGAAGTPTTYHLTMAVSPAGGGTTTPAVGTHEVSSPRSISATAANGHSFLNWTATENATVADPNASSTTVTLIGDATVTANFSSITVDIQANGSDGPITVTPNDRVSIRISLDPSNLAGQNADWWIAVNTPFAAPGNWYTYVYPSGWRSGINLCAQTGLFHLAPFELLNMALPKGNYTFYFAIDDPDGLPTGPWWGLDSVLVQVQ